MCLKTMNILTLCIWRVVDGNQSHNPRSDLHGSNNEGRPHKSQASMKNFQKSRSLRVRQKSGQVFRSVNIRQGLQQTILRDSFRKALQSQGKDKKPSGASTEVVKNQVDLLGTHGEFLKIPFFVGTQDKYFRRRRLGYRYVSFLNASTWFRESQI